MAVLCVLAVVLSSMGALLLGLAFTTIPWTIEPGLIVFQSDSDRTAYVAELASGGVALGLGCGCAAILALRCCCGSHSLLA
ncbi:unnamed protein product [Miscanthus lutarioriparius]|uniref:Uncharacterized protein n=1 Tax=Miscanthus lutarioriparius TaxID=422564 RepID=A0A811NHK7_9POAL|nr:unnamed protein product [Miscanthus lutarioriparius]